MSAGTADKLIGRLPAAERRKVLDAAARSSHGYPVLVEYAYERKLEGATRIVARLEGTAYAPGTGSGEVLIAKPHAQRLRLHAISVAHVLRITSVTLVDTDETPTSSVHSDDSDVRYRLGEVLAGPPRKAAKA